MQWCKPLLGRPTTRLRLGRGFFCRDDGQCRSHCRGLEDICQQPRWCRLYVSFSMFQGCNATDIERIVRDVLANPLIQMARQARIGEAV